MSPTPKRRPSKKPLPVPVGVAVLGGLFVVGVVLVVLPELFRGGWGGFWRAAQIAGLILAGVLLYRWLVERFGKGPVSEEDVAPGPPGPRDG